MTLEPAISGRLAIRSPAARFVDRFQQRVAAGLLTGQPHSRSNYRVSSATTGHLTVQAADWRTAISVGLNDVDLELSQPFAVEYRVRYWRWAWFCVALCGVLGLTGIALLLLFDARAYMEETLLGRMPGLSPGQNLAIAWGMTIFWGFVWPWIMIGLHKRPLHKLMARLISEVDDRG